MPVQRTRLRLQHRQGAGQRIGPLQPLADTGERAAQHRRPRVGGRQVVRLHVGKEALQCRRQLRLVIEQQRAQVGGEARQRHRRPAREVARQAVVEPHVQQDAGVTSIRRRQSRLRRPHLRMRVGIDVDGAMQADAGDHLARPRDVGRATHEIAEHAAQPQRVVVTGQQRVRKMVHDG